jgi:hypothetical protein
MRTAGLLSGDETVDVDADKEGVGKVVVMEVEETGEDTDADMDAQKEEAEEETGDRDGTDGGVEAEMDDEEDDDAEVGAEREDGTEGEADTCAWKGGEVVVVGARRLELSRMCSRSRLDRATSRGESVLSATGVGADCWDCCCGCCACCCGEKTDGEWSD